MVNITGHEPVLPGLEKLVQVLDSAVAGRSPAHAYSAVRNALPLLLDDRQVRLPPTAYRPHRQHYARHELHCSRAHGYSVVAMVWAPGQGTPLHDHGGHWCVEAVWSGQLEITPYSVLEADNRAGWRFVPGRSRLHSRGDCLGLQPPAQYHTVRNPSSDTLAVSLHVYPQLLRRCTVFEPIGQGHYLPQTLALAAQD